MTGDSSNQLGTEAGDAPRSEPHTLTTDAYPRRFGTRYILLKELGKGGMGQVFMALTGQSGAERVCALKIIRQVNAPGREPGELARRFLDEAKLVTKLSHENLVYVFDFGAVDAGDVYLAMEYVRGKSLTEVWNRCAVRAVGFPLGVALYVVSEIAHGLGYAHGLEHLRLVHRDISPSNLMLSYTGGAKLIDFGLAKWKSKAAQTVTGINWGKVSYMSPEQYTGRDIDHRSDVFSLGVILWELLTGKQLFPDEGVRHALTRIPPPSEINANVNPTLDRIVFKALALDPDDRFASGDALAAALQPHLPREAGKLQLQRFLNQLFDTDARSEAAEEEQLVARAQSLAPNGDAQRAAPPTEATPPPISRDPLVGTVLEGRYFVRRLVGEGAMGRVYEGHHTGMGKRVAIKLPRHGERRRNELVQRFRLEATAASQIGHANIANVTDCGMTPAGDFFFVMEYVDGIDLDRLIGRDGPLGVERALVIAVQICRALEAAHRAGIIHRDLKPSNVMLVRTRDEAEVVKVLDFGVAKFLRADAQQIDLTRAHAAVGTPRYMAPEQIENGNDIDFRVDIYALGGVLYAMLSGGHAPIEGDSVEHVWRRKLTDDAPSIRKYRADVPPDLEALLASCLAREPGRRPPSMEALKRRLLAVLETTRQAGSSVLGIPVPSETAAVGEPSVRPRRRRRVLIAAGGGVALAGGVMLAVWQREPARSQATAVIAASPPPVTTSPALVVTPDTNRAGIAVPVPEAEAPEVKTTPALADEDATPRRRLRGRRKTESASEVTTAGPAKAMSAADYAALGDARAKQASVAVNPRDRHEELSRAAAAYERALMLAPDDASAKRALDSVRAALQSIESAGDSPASTSRAQ